MPASEWKRWWAEHPKGDGPLPPNRVERFVVAKKFDFSVPPPSVLGTRSLDLPSDFFSKHTLLCAIEPEKGGIRSVVMRLQSDKNDQMLFKSEGFSVADFVGGSRFKIKAAIVSARRSEFQGSGWIDLVPEGACRKVVFGGDFTYLVDRAFRDSIYFYVRASLFKLSAWDHDRGFSDYTPSHAKRAVFTGTPKK
jgi:hypothetical protein